MINFVKVEFDYFKSIEIANKCNVIDNKKTLSMRLRKLNSVLDNKIKP